MTYGDDANKVAYSYDNLGRTTAKTLTVGSRAYETGYSYLPGSNGSGNTTALISVLSQPGEAFSYTYDDVGNISSVTRNGVTTTYLYDKLGQLIRVNDPEDTADGTTWVYEYDLGGNILCKKRYAYTTGDLGSVLETIAYEYDSVWKDKLVKYDGNAITYDAIGNPLTDGTWTYTWEKGRQLKQMTKSGTTATCAYNADGLRIRKTVGSTVTNYTLHGKNIVHMTQGSNSLHFYYDASNKLAIVEYNGTKYAYVHNLQGDIVAILDSNGTAVVQYKYDAWGKPISKTGSMKDGLGTLNPFRYRGYVYDEETGLYYLRTRYYNPEFSRFCCADIEIHTNAAMSDARLYVYCNNNPLCFSDSEGTFALTSFLIGLAVSTLVTSIATAIVGEDIVSGASTTANGAAAVYTGIGLLSFGPVGWLAGGALILVGSATVVMGANEIAEGFTGTNYIQECTGMNDETYDYLYYGLNTVSSVGTIAGNAYMRNNPRYPGNNPNRKPDGFTEWRGQPPEGGDKGAWYNPRNKQSLHPDLNHPEGVAPHWDWNTPNGQYRIFRFHRELKK